MNIVIKQRLLLEHLNYVIKGISNKNLIPILGCIKFSLEKDGLYLMSTDNDIAIKSFIPNNQIEKIEVLGEFVVSGKYIYEIIRKLPNELITIEEIVDSKIFISTENSKFNLNCNLIADFPNLDFEENKNSIALDVLVFKKMINQIIFATSTQESRPVLTGINFKIESNILECTATDSYRLAKKTIELDGEYENVNIIIPAKNILEISKMLSETGTLSIHIFNNKIIFNFDNIKVISRLINGTFPDTNKLIPIDSKENIILNLNSLYEAVDRASLLTNETEKNPVKIKIEKNLLIVSSNIPEIGNVEEKIIINNEISTSIEIAFSAKYMLDALKAFACEEIKILYNGDLKPLIIKNNEEDTLTQLILPIRTY
ncbi:MAG: DNA polymerase III subunit beta [Bacilli bacterium]|nr:DNA polymerase III subunit beta [Bacilli bacterium]